MILIADSGSTKTLWSLVKADNEPASCTTKGLNPFFVTEDDIIKILTDEYTLEKTGITAIYFYGAGCVPAKKSLIQNALEVFFGKTPISVESDLLGAARSLCGHKPGIACILGTGSNSCYYDGTEIAENISPLGYILGDEGSGAVLGRKLVADVLKNQLPKNICDDFFATYNITPAEIVENTYRKPFPNRFLAQFTRFIVKYINQKEIEQIVFASFVEFFTRNVCQYPQAGSLPIHFTGSIATVFQDVLKKAASSLNLTVGTISQNPATGLIDYHTK